MGRYKRIWNGGRSISCIYGGSKPDISRVLPVGGDHRFSLPRMWAYPRRGVFAHWQSQAGMGDESGYFPDCGGSGLFWGQQIFAWQKSQRNQGAAHNRADSSLRGILYSHVSVFSE